MFDQCQFMLGEGRSILIALPTFLPVADSYTVSVSPQTVRFVADRERITEIPYDNADVFERLSFAHEVGLVESKDGLNYPEYITNVAYIEVRKSEVMQ